MNICYIYIEVARCSTIFMNEKYLSDVENIKHQGFRKALISLSFIVYVKGVTLKVTHTGTVRMRGMLLMDLSRSL